MVKRVAKLRGVWLSGEAVGKVVRSVVSCEACGKVVRSVAKGMSVP
jgi:hypothetical protein